MSFEKNRLSNDLVQSYVKLRTTKLFVFLRQRRAFFLFLLILHFNAECDSEMRFEQWDRKKTERDHKLRNQYKNPEDGSIWTARKDRIKSARALMRLRKSLNNNSNAVPTDQGRFLCSMFGETCRMNVREKWKETASDITFSPLADPLR